MTHPGGSDIEQRDPRWQAGRAIEYARPLSNELDPVEGAALRGVIAHGLAGITLALLEIKAQGEAIRGDDDA